MAEAKLRMTTSGPAPASRNAKAYGTQAPEHYTCYGEYVRVAPMDRLKHSPYQLWAATQTLRYNK